MEHFRRSLKYLWPYRGRITVAVLCVIIIAALWGGGLGLMLPAAKILISDEGLHGWVYSMSAEDRLGVKLDVVPVSAEFAGEISQKLKLPGLPATSLLEVIKVEDDGRAHRAGLKPRWYLLQVNRTGPGVDSSEPDNSDKTAASFDPRTVAREISTMPPEQDFNLVVFDGHGKKTITISSAPVKVGFWNRLRDRTVQSVVNIVRAIPEPATYAGRFAMFANLLVVLLVINVIRCLFTFIQEYLVGTAIWLGIMDLRCENYNKVLHLPTTFFSEKGVSDATSRFIQDTNELARGQNTLLGKTMVEPAKAISTLIMALVLSWQLTLIAVLAGPPAYFVIRRLGKSMHRASRKSLESWSMMLAVLGETLQGIRVVKAYTMEGSERKRFFRVNRRLVKQQNRMELLDAITGPSVELLGLVAALVAAGLAGYLVFKGMTIWGVFHKMDRYTFMVWMGTLFALFDPVRKLAKVSTKFQQSDAAAKRVFELQDAPKEPHVPNPVTLPRHSTSIEFRDVNFRYPSAAVNAVKDFNLMIQAGQTVAIVGPNGSGKTTLVSMLPRLLDPTNGTILVDGHDITQMSYRSLRRQIGLVTQDTVLFHATIGENISYGLRRPKHEDVLAASRKAFVDEFVRDLPAGYDTMVGEHGTTLSGGQKQRISIARAILRDPAILIFDEAMSQVDSDSERRIHQAMEEFIKGRTTLMIAHRFATVLSADRIVVMADGSLVDSGTHQELLDRCELYHHLYRTQFMDSGGTE